MSSRRILLILVALLAPSFVYLNLFTSDLDRRTLFARLTGYTLEPGRFDPAVGSTVGIYRGSSADVRLKGALPHDILVSQEAGSRISRIGQDGTVRWTRKTGDPVLGLERLDGLAVYATHDRLAALDPADGREVWAVRAPFDIGGIGSDDRGILVIPFSASDPIHRAEFARGPRAPPDRMIAEDTHPPPVFARHAVGAAGLMIVANTFAHRVDIRSRSTGRWLAATHASYPNYVQRLADGAVVIAAEHGNRLLRFDPATNTREVLFGCPYPLYSDAKILPDQIAARQHEAKEGDRSVCDAAISPGGLYSPNGFHVASGDVIYVADTDNHRVVARDLDGLLTIGEVTGLNSPNRVIALDDDPPARRSR